MKHYDGILITDLAGSVWGRTAGAYRIATVLRHVGYKIKVVDCITDFSIEEISLLLKKSVSSKTLFLGISANFLYQSRKAPWLPQNSFRKNNFSILENLVRLCRDQYPHIKIFIAGPNAGSFQNLDADLYITGYADSLSLQLVNQLKENSYSFEKGFHLVSQDKNFDMENLSIDYTPEDFLFRGETLVLEVSRGCRYKCKFCSYPLNGRESGRYTKSAEAIYTELMKNYDSYGTTSYYFADDTYNESLEKIQYYNAVFKKLPFQLQFFSYLRLDLIQRYPEMIPLLKESGIKSAFFGIESLNQKSAHSIGKANSREQTLSLLQNIQKQWKDDVMVTTSFIVGLPHENKDTFSYWLKDLCDPNFPSHNIQMMPLHINFDTKKMSWASEIDLHPEKYGYSIQKSPVGTYWKNEHWDFFECSDLVNQFYSTSHGPAVDEKKIRNHYQHMNLLGYGISHAELLKINSNDPSFLKRVREPVQSRIYQYKAATLNDL